MTNDVNVSKKTHFLTKTAILSVLAYVVFLIEIPVFFAPAFLKIDASDLFALLGAFAMGPVAGIAIELIKNLLHMITVGSSGGIGELANFIVGVAWIVPAAIIYRRNKTKTNAVIGMFVGIICMAVVAAVFNYYVLIPFYTRFMPIEAIVGMGNAVNTKIVDLKSLIIYAIIPFNVFKGGIITILTLLVYKKLSPILHK